MLNKVVPLADLMKEAKAMAQNILENSSAILKLAKSAINNGANVDLNTGLNIEIECFAQCFATEDQKEAMKAFLEKRKPVSRINKAGKSKIRVRSQVFLIFMIINYEF